MSKREIVIRIDSKTITLAVAFMAVGFLGNRIYHVAGRLLSHVPHPHIGSLRPSPAGPPVEILCDFESEAEGALWKLRGVKLARVSEHATHGQWAGRFSYPARQEGPAALIEDALEDHKIRSNWSGYDALAFEIHNPQTHQERLILQVKDGDGKAYKQNLYLNPESGERITVALDDIKAGVDVTRIAQLNFFEQNPDCLIHQTEETWIRNGKRVNPMKKHQKYGGWIFEKCLPLCLISPSAVMMHRRLFDETGLFDESLPACEDYDLWLRITCQHPVGLTEKSYVVKYGGHADQRSHEFPAMDRFRIYSLKKILDSGKLNAEQTEAARKMLEEKEAIYNQGALKRGRNETLSPL